MKDLHLQQLGDETVDTIKGNVDKTYELPAHEKHMVHVRLEIKSFNAATGEKTSSPFVQQFYPKEFDTMEAAGNFKGYTVEVLHDPRREGQMLKDKIQAGISSPLVSPNLDKPLEEMSPEELSLKYAELFKEEAPKNAIQWLRDQIEDKIAQMRAASHEVAPEDFRTASNPAQGDLNDGVRDGAVTETSLLEEAAKKLAEEEEAAKKAAGASTATGTGAARTGRAGRQA